MEKRARQIFAAFVGLWTSFSIGLMAIACAPADEAATSVEESWIEEGQRALYASEPKAARLAFEAALSEAPGHGQASFYLALSELLLLPEGPAAHSFFAQIGMQAPRMSARVYGARGLLYRLSRGLDAERALDQLRVDLGGPEEHWTDPASWLERLPKDTSLASLAATLGLLSDELMSIGEHLHRAAASPELVAVVPGTLLHLRGDLNWGPQEAAILAAGADGVAAILSAVRSYSWSEEPLHGLKANAPEQSAEELSRRLAEALPPANLDPSRRLLSGALNSIQNALSMPPKPPDESYGEVIAWEQIPEDELMTVAELVRALERSLYEATSLPSTEPATTFRLHTLFEQPPSPARTSPAWLVDENRSLHFNGHFVEEWLDAAEVASPPLGEGADIQHRFFVSEGPEEGWLGEWLKPLLVRLAEDLGIG